MYQGASGLSISRNSSVLNPKVDELIRGHANFENERKAAAFRDSASGSYTDSYAEIGLNHDLVRKTERKKLGVIFTFHHGLLMFRDYFTT